MEGPVMDYFEDYDTEHGRNEYGEHFLIKDNETKEYFVSNVSVNDISELTAENTVSPMTKNYTDAQDMVKLLGADATLKHITPDGLTKIRSDRGKKAWEKKQALAKA